MVLISFLLCLESFLEDEVSGTSGKEDLRRLDQGNNTREVLVVVETLLGVWD